ncbi:RNA polymerase sigma factor [Phycicoccus flavus]|uniref:RNA polymerase sigma factor n=1 Tax=Phycicoccus flavus TaxID=2502783 RepID=UPI000FEC1B62|nr:sigma-70 family RNA polymerase sigma factor [Phycicoccus flavus]NHA68924.1 sigma-70 family RNA polymerase sigma factor [Phycicoccus flavus]
MGHPEGNEEDRAQARFREVWAAAHDDVLRFAARRVHPSHAEDVVADTFLVVWRRLEDLPADPGEARAWIFGIARRTLMGAQRGDRRRDALAVRLADPALAAGPPGTGDPDVLARRLDLAAAWPRLAATDQEALALAYWDGLTSTEAATVLGISPVAFRLRLTRARRHLHRHLDLVERATGGHLPLTEGSPS